LQLVWLNPGDPLGQPVTQVTQHTSGEIRILFIYIFLINLKNMKLIYEYLTLYFFYSIHPHELFLNFSIWELYIAYRPDDRVCVLKCFLLGNVLK
jgi:hypothetical protein